MNPTVSPNKQVNCQNYLAHTRKLAAILQKPGELDTRAIKNQHQYQISNRDKPQEN
jgi:hypothetical protein